MPAIQVRRLREIGVATQSDPAKTGPTTQVDGEVEIDIRALVARTIARSIVNVEHFLGFS